MRSIEFWKKRYVEGGDSGLGSQGQLFNFKVEFLNKFIEDKKIKSIIDFGHGDLKIAKGLNCKSYTGIDIYTPRDKKGLNLINCRFDEYVGATAELTVCLDVIYHILKEEQDYMRRTLDKLIEKSKKYIIVYAHDSRKVEFFDKEYSSHLFNSKWLQHYLKKRKEDVKLVYEQEKPYFSSTAQFFIFEKI